jgi:biopolymer transport protein ExbB
MEEVGRREAGALERGVNILATIANLAPLLGLLGTVTGMIQVFQGVVRQAQEVGGQVNVGNLAGGIWEALITTAAGLTVAIPVIVLHRILVGVVDRHLNEMEERSLELADSMTQEAASKAAMVVAGAEADASGEARP